MMPHIRVAVCVLSVVLAAATGGSAWSAAGTTCLCRSEDGRTFYETTHRHSRWACDVKLGYIHVQETETAETDEPKETRARTRPTIETCNAEEIVQFKVWSCMQRGCTYAYAKAVEVPNRALQRIEKLRGKRSP